MAYQCKICHFDCIDVVLLCLYASAGLQQLDASLREYYSDYHASVLQGNVMISILGKRLLQGLRVLMKAVLEL